MGISASLLERQNKLNLTQSGSILFILFNRSNSQQYSPQRDLYCRLKTLKTTVWVRTLKQCEGRTPFTTTGWADRATSKRHSLIWGFKDRGKEESPCISSMGNTERCWCYWAAHHLIIIQPESFLLSVTDKKKLCERWSTNFLGSEGGHSRESVRTSAHSFWFSSFLSSSNHSACSHALWMEISPWKRGLHPARNITLRWTALYWFEKLSTNYANVPPQHNRATRSPHSRD